MGRPMRRSFRPLSSGCGGHLNPADIVVMDQLSAHKATGIRQDFARRRVRLRYWPPSSPGVSPVERGVSQRNTALWVAKVRMRAALDMEL
jgi:DDE superfamily endonuclease